MLAQEATISNTCVTGLSILIHTTNSTEGLENKANFIFHIVLFSFVFSFFFLMFKRATKLQSSCLRSHKYNTQGKEVSFHQKVNL